MTLTMTTHYNIITLWGRRDSMVNTQIYGDEVSSSNLCLLIRFSQSQYIHATCCKKEDYRVVWQLNNPYPKRLCGDGVLYGYLIWDTCHTRRGR